MTDTSTNDSDPTKSVVIERTFDAPIELVWSMWTDADHFAAWYGPMGARIPHAEMDVTVGGKRHGDHSVMTTLPILRRSLDIA